MGYSKKGGFATASEAEKMLIYGKEVSNRKQEIDRQYHTILNRRS